MERNFFAYKPEPVRDPNGGTGFIMVPDDNEVSLSESFNVLKAAVETQEELNKPETTGESILPSDSPATE